MKATIIIIVSVIVVIALFYYFLIYKPSQVASNLMEGAPCKTGGLPGTVKNGVCVVNPPKEEQLPCGSKLNPC